MLIKELRKSKKIKSNEMAKMLGIKPSTYSGKEMGCRKFSASEIKIITNFFGVDINLIDDIK